ncbi:hypothetical protein EJ02DRAFT_232090 [Clathrospora elynae]|uniref:C2H2-type domain-containing protein n=1 Tax=Clathrospora elynae TaxID=706981 RepID=A0A6A5SLK3_9PLEO|nr:hypothetical protein EJ02DRAFT_232090 [Clathrospora elynae]
MPSPKSTCNACGRTFKHPKDLKRHQGQRGSTSSCPALRTQSSQLKPFACSCDERSYTQKDSLQRHMDRENVKEGGLRHKCKNCQHCRCRCPVSTPIPTS